jgi:hypothetical protein
VVALACSACLHDVRDLTAARRTPFERPSGLSAQSWGLCSLIGPRNRNPGVYGTDLGLTARRDNDRKLTMLFGDTWVRARDGCRYPSPTSDDFQALLPRQRPAPFGPGAPKQTAAASCELLEYGFDRPDDPTSWQRLRLFPSSVARSDDSVLDTSMLRTPVAAFSDGQHMFVYFSRGDPTYCSDAADCPPDMRCSAQAAVKLGTCTNTFQFSADSPPAYCRDEKDCGLASHCVAPARGVCLARRPFRVSTPSGTVVPTWYRDDPRRAIAQTLYIAAAVWPERPTDYAVVARYPTNLFQNVAVRSIAFFDAEHPERNDYRPGYHTLLIWGRRNFAEFGGAQALPFLSYVPLDELRTEPDAMRWQPRYFAGYGVQGEPTWSRKESDAQPVYGNEARIVEADGAKLDWREPEFDYVEWSTVSYVAPLKRWVMLYGGDLPAFLVLDPRTSEVRKPVHLQFAPGAIHMRTATHPWGSLRRNRDPGWSSPEPILTRQAIAPYLACGTRGSSIMSGCVQDAAVDTKLPPIVRAAGVPRNDHEQGLLESAPKCLAGEVAFGVQNAASGDLIGRLYAPNIIDDWTQDVTAKGRAANAPRSAEIYWNVSTWNPYQVILVKSRIDVRQ